LIALLGVVPAANTVRSFRFATDDLPEPQRASALLGLRERGLLPLEPLPGFAVHASISKLFFPGIGILSGTLSGLRQGGTRQTQGADDELFFAVNLTGRSTASQGQRELSFGEGQALLLSGADGFFGVLRPTPVRFLGLRLPRRLLAPLARGLDDSTMRVIPAATEPLRLLTGYISVIADNRDGIPTETASTVAAHLHELVALSLGATRELIAAAAGSLRAARLYAIKNDIVGRLGDSDLTLTAVAARHRVTPRYVHKLFEVSDTTYTRFVLVQRLDLACRMLRNPRHSARSISSIAYDVGFGDLSYFNRTFRRRYGATPSDIRNEVARHV